MSRVIVYLPPDGFLTEIHNNAYLQADDSTVLIRKKVDGCWTTTAVYAPGSYHRVYSDIGGTDEEIRDKRK